MPRIRAAGIVIKDEKILLMYRINEGLEYYAFPGGGQEEGETLEQTVIREFDEETSVIVKPTQLLYHIVWDSGDENYFYLCDYVSGTAQLSEVSEEFAQMQIDDQVYEPTWIEISLLPHLTLYQLEIRDLLIRDIENGFKDEVEELKINVEDRRE